MVERFGGGPGRPEYLVRRDSNRRGPEPQGIPLRSGEGTGDGEGVPDLRADPFTPPTHTPLRDGDRPVPDIPGRQEPLRDGRGSGDICSGHVGERSNSRTSEDQSVSSAQETIRSKLAFMADRYRGSSIETTSPAASPWLRNGDDIPLSDHLDRITAKALREQEYILDEPYSGDLDQDRQLRRDKAAVAQAVLTSALRADENRLRKRGQDLLPQILADAEVLIAARRKTIDHSSE
jgi:hypothetical protein